MAAEILARDISIEEAKDIAEYAWLGLDHNELTQGLKNPFQRKDNFALENPHLFVLGLMRNPDYFGFTCKYLLNRDLAPFQLAILRELWFRPFPMLIACRGAGKSFMLALYALLRAVFTQGSKIVIVGSAFRQAKYVFEYAEEIWHDAPLLRDMVGDSVRSGPRRDIDRCTFKIGDSLIVALPLGSGDKIRGQRANVILVDEFSSISPDIFERVISGFAAVAMSPIEKMKARARKASLKKMGFLFGQENEVAIPGMNSNQTVISGTAYYSFNHFYEYWKRYKAIIESKGDANKLAEIFPDGVPDKFDWRDYSIFRLPVGKLPPDYMDEKHVAKAQATVHIGIWDMEYNAVFSTDSNGFFKASLINSCVVGRASHPIELPSCGLVKFHCVLKGHPKFQYVIGVDPASEKDNFSITLLELWPDHRRIVYCWTTTRSRHKDKLKAGLTDEQDFTRFVARKIRELTKLFPTALIAMDSQGGGFAVMEALADTATLQPGEKAILPVIEEEDEKPTDNVAGDHILKIVNFSNAEWVGQANHTMKKDFEDKALLFPEYNSAVIGLAIEEDKATGRVKETADGQAKLYDTLEDCALEIQDLRDELATIVHTRTGTTQRDRWDTPETKEPGGKKGRLRKDRYTALLMANFEGRTFQKIVVQEEYKQYGGFAGQIQTKEKAAGPLYNAPLWFTEKMNNENLSGSNYGRMVRKSG